MSHLRSEPACNNMGNIRGSYDGMIPRFIGCGAVAKSRRTRNIHRLVCCMILQSPPRQTLKFGTVYFRIRMPSDLRTSLLSSACSSNVLLLARDSHSMSLVSSRPLVMHWHRLCTEPLFSDLTRIAKQIELTDLIPKQFSNPKTGMFL